MDFDLDSHLDKVYSTYPEADNRPVIGITSNFVNGDAVISEKYYKQVVRAGGVPLLIPPVSDIDVIVNTLERIDGLLLSGGADINPLWCGEEPSPRLHAINAERDLPELQLVRLAYNRQVPMLGICRGIQVMAVALGGEAEQDIDEAMQRNGSQYVIRHSQDARRNEPTHSVSVSRESVLFELYGSEKLYVNSFHHQSVRKSGRLLTVTATSPDGVIEAVESTRLKPVMGVQWHPECLEDDGVRLFEWLVDNARSFAKAKAIHEKVLTVDTHCDTPMFFSQGVDFEKRDSRILVDMHKMSDGRQDAVFMVAYLPQPKQGETFMEKNPFGIESPKDYANLIFDKIDAIASSNSKWLSLASTPQQLYANKAEGKKSIVLGIENGLALEHDITNVKSFAERGVAYITLCHNGDNDICDSARGEGMHGGVSEFGEQVIKEMNRQGVMVDLSHAAESSFYDAIDISSMPIVCSHSNCKSLCDVPRNLTDEQLRRLAQTGGVAHVTLYAGFLRSNGEASILDAMRHLEHAIDVMGIEHVGIGTDFDGDGGVLGMADASEAINFTLQLLRRRYSLRDIRNIWGGNWLRVMAEVQNNIRR